MGARAYGTGRETGTIGTGVRETGTEHPPSQIPMSVIPLSDSLLPYGAGTAVMGAGTLGMVGGVQETGGTGMCIPQRECHWVCHSIRFFAAVGSGDGGDGGWYTWDGRRGTGDWWDWDGGRRSTGDWWDWDGGLPIVKKNREKVVDSLRVKAVS